MVALGVSVESGERLKERMKRFRSCFGLTLVNSWWRWRWRWRRKPWDNAGGGGGEGGIKVENGGVRGRKGVRVEF